MDFSAALQELKRGNKVTRNSWTGTGMFTEMRIYPDYRSETPLPGLCFNYLTGAKTPGIIMEWIPSRADIFAEDWSIVA